MGIANSVTKEGNIRTNKTCPFLSKCANKSATCPQRGNTRNTQFSCGWARLFTSAYRRRESDGTTSVQTVQTISTPLPSIEAVVNTKKDERNRGKLWIEL